MSKMSELSQVLDELIVCGEKMISIAKDIKEIFSEPDTTKPVVTETASIKQAPVLPSKEEVRALLAQKANEANGQYKMQVKSIVKKYGNGGNLSNVPPESYPALIKELEELSNG